MLLVIGDADAKDIHDEQNTAIALWHARSFSVWESSGVWESSRRRIGFHFDHHRGWLSSLTPAIHILPFPAQIILKLTVWEKYLFCRTRRNENGLDVMLAASVLGAHILFHWLTHSTDINKEL